MAAATSSTARQTNIATAMAGSAQPPALPRAEWRKLLGGLIVFAVLFALPLGWARFDRSLFEAIALARWYAQEHFVLCSTLR